MKELEKIIGHTFKNKTLLTTALTHSSYANESKTDMQYNERLEFLGDSVLQLISGEKMYTTVPILPEGEMSKHRAAMVCEDSLAEYAMQISLGDYLLLGKGERQNGGRNRPSILADAFEAVIGALFIDGGFDCAKRFVLPFLDEKHQNLSDYKTFLQEVIRQNPEERISYHTVSQDGPAHDRVFTVEVWLNTNVIGSGVGKTKKQAEQAAAKQALSLMGYNY